MKMRYRFIFNALLGCTLGILIGAVTWVFLTTDEEYANRMALLAQLFGSGIYGAICMGGTIVYDIESWSLIRATATHYITTFTAFFITNALLGWFGSDIVLIAFIFLTIGYFIIWIIEYTIYKRQVRKLNEDLKSLIKETEE